MARRAAVKTLGWLLCLGVGCAEVERGPVSYDLPPAVDSDGGECSFNGWRFRVWSVARTLPVSQVYEFQRSDLVEMLRTLRHFAEAETTARIEWLDFHCGPLADALAEGSPAVCSVF